MSFLFIPTAITRFDAKFSYQSKPLILTLKTPLMSSFLTFHTSDIRETVTVIERHLQVTYSTQSSVQVCHQLSLFLDLRLVVLPHKPVLFFF